MSRFSGNIAFRYWINILLGSMGAVAIPIIISKWPENSYRGYLPLLVAIFLIVMAIISWRQLHRALRKYYASQKTPMLFRLRVEPGSDSRNEKYHLSVKPSASAQETDYFVEFYSDLKRPPLGDDSQEGFIYAENSIPVAIELDNRVWIVKKVLRSSA